MTQESAGRFFLLQFAATDGPGALGTVLERRRRPFTVVERHRGDALPDGHEDARALVVLPLAGDGDPSGERELVARWHELDIPVLGLGSGALLVAEALGAAPVASTPRPWLLILTPAEAADDDALVGPLPRGAHWLATVDALGPLPADLVVLALDELGQPMIFRKGTTYGVGIRPDLGPEEVARRVEDEAVEQLAGRDAFMRANGESLLGRWVDLVVGRTDDEAPWGRRGPGPVPRAGLRLHPA